MTEQENKLPRSDADSVLLREAFEKFILTSQVMEKAYFALQAKVDELNLELERKNEELSVQLAATERARTFMPGVPRSSPSVALFRDGKLVFVLPRRAIEGKTESEVAQLLIPAFNEHCTRKGPSVPREQMLAVYRQYEPPCSSELRVK